MEDFRFADNLDGEAVIALGLPAPRLILAGLGSAGAWALAELPLPAALRLSAAAVLALTTAILAWGKVQGVSVARWAWFSLGFAGRGVATWTEGHQEWVSAELGPGAERGSLGSEACPTLVAGWVGRDRTALDLLGWSSEPQDQLSTPDRRD
jgi:hypothetical protein